MRLNSGFLEKKIYWLFLWCMLLSAACTTPRPPTLIPFADGEFWVLGSNLVFTIPGTGQRIVVPRGFVTDFASVPRIFWTVFPKHGEYTTAAIVHDYLYWRQQCTREQADELFEFVMKDSDVSSGTRFAIYGAVRFGGGAAWESNQQAREDGYIRIIPEMYMSFPIKTRWSDYREYLRDMVDDIWREEEFRTNNTPPYCAALEESGSDDEEVPAEPVMEREQESNEPEQEPENMPLPESAIGA